MLMRIPDMDFVGTPTPMVIPISMVYFREGMSHMLPIHQQFINQAMEKIRQDSRLTGLLVGGSVIRGTGDAFSDLEWFVFYCIALNEGIMQIILCVAKSLGIV